MSVAYISLGSNMGDRIKAIKKAIQLLDDHPDIIVNKV